MRDALDKARLKLQRHGAAAAAHQLAMKALNRARPPSLPSARADPALR